MLRATSPDGVAMTSAETAIVSIPETGSGDILALVEAPGAPSRLITVPKAEPALVQVEPVVDGKKAAVETPVAAVEKQPEPTVTEMAKAEPAKPAKPAKSSAPAGARLQPAKLRIEAVEIDGPTVFVAGSADVGARIRVYANDILLGENIANAEGRFLVDVNRNLAVGDYVIRADSIGPNAVDVLSRVSVPFTRSEGEKLAAVAPQITVPVAPRLPSTPPVISSEQSVTTTDTSLAQRLAPVDQSVIIRRGDTLWQISRRIYGRGVKYTTIYAANQAQIEDPNRIWPGQVFTLPEEAPAAN
ncbi:MAG: LysM peptidoglycan-binding domain-containing protein [Ahrensia sp.]|nr:LysM peptidoglycan-binding domain-containing protein [Ahrensia sp.]